MTSSMVFDLGMEGINLYGGKVWLLVEGITLVLVKAILLSCKGKLFRARASSMLFDPIMEDFIFVGIKIGSSLFL